MNEIAEFFLPFLKVSNFFGFLPFNLQSNGILKISIPHIFYSFVLLIVLLYTVYLRIIHFDQYRLEGSLLSKIAFLCAIFNSIAFIIISFFMNIVHKTVLESIMITLWDFDNKVGFIFLVSILKSLIISISQVKIFNFHQDYKTLKKHSILTLSTVIICFICFFTIPWLIAAKIFKMELEEFLGGFLASFIWCGFYIYSTISCILLLAVQKRFTIINKIIKRNLTRLSILLTSKLHMSLSELVFRSSKIFSFQMALMLGITVINFTFALFEVYTLSKEVLSFEKKYYCLCAAGINVYFSTAIIFMYGTSSYVTKESRKTLEILNFGIYNEERLKKKETMRRIEILLLQIQHFNAKISCGFFKLDWKAVMLVSKYKK